MDAESATAVLQRSSPDETNEAIHRLADAFVDAAGSAPGIVPVQGVPPHGPEAFRLSNAVRSRLDHRLASLRAAAGREALILHWSRARGRVSSTEAADLMGLSKVSAGRLLTRLADDDRLKEGRAERRGRGFFYVPTGSRQ